MTSIFESITHWPLKGWINFTIRLGYQIAEMVFSFYYCSGSLFSVSLKGKQILMEKDSSSLQNNRTWLACKRSTIIFHLSVTDIEQIQAKPKDAVWQEEFLRLLSRGMHAFCLTTFLKGLLNMAQTIMRSSHFHSKRYPHHLNAIRMTWLACILLCHGTLAVWKKSIISTCYLFSVTEWCSTWATGIPSVQHFHKCESMNI